MGFISITIGQFSAIKTKSGTFLCPADRRRAVFVGLQVYGLLCVLPTGIPCFLSLTNNFVEDHRGCARYVKRGGGGSGGHRNRNGGIGQLIKGAAQSFCLIADHHQTGAVEFFLVDGRLFVRRCGNDAESRITIAQ